MTALEILCDLIADFEGCELVAYKCPAGVWTIGRGFTGKEVHKGLVWSQEHANEMTIKRAQQAINEAIDASPVLRYQSAGKIASISDFIYNCGINAYRKSTLKKRVDATDWGSAKVELMRWTKANGKVLPGLVKRRKKEALLLG
ncbi:MAG: lysozyme [Candidatus Obscuribacterales bacterium]|jgi:lysozyme